MTHRHIATNYKGDWLWKSTDYTTHKKAKHLEAKLELCREAINELYEEVDTLTICLRAKERV